MNRKEEGDAMSDDPRTFQGGGRGFQRPRRVLDRIGVVLGIALVATGICLIVIFSGKAISQAAHDAVNHEEWKG